MNPPKVIACNLEDGTFELKVREDLFDRIGGLGVALALFEEFLEKDPIIFAIGPASGIFPGCSKTLALFRSPYNNALATSFAGGNLARVLRFAGCDAVVFYGKSPRPSLVAIEDEQIFFRDAQKLWGKTAFDAYKQIFAKEGVPGLRSILNIGPAGEKQIAFSSVLVDEFFSFPRDGLGAKFGEKNLKGLIFSSSGSNSVKDLKNYRGVFLDLYKKAKNHTRLSSLGTLKNLEALQRLYLVPEKNLTSLSTGRIEVEKFPGASKRISCGGCPVGCIHVGQIQKFTPYDFEAVVSLGPLLGLDNPTSILELIFLANDLGLDPTSLGVILGYLVESQNLSFSDAETYKRLILALVAQEEEWAKSLAKGLQSYVGQSDLFDLALVLGGKEILPYFNGYASLVTQSLSLGSTTEENRGFLLDLEFYGKTFSDEELVEKIISQEVKKTLSELMIGCGYLNEVYEDVSVCFSILNSLGYQFPHEQLEKIAKEVFFKKVKLNFTLGFTSPGKFSKKFFLFPSAHGILSEERIKKMIEVFEIKIS